MNIARGILAAAVVAVSTAAAAQPAPAGDAGALPVLTLDEAVAKALEANPTIAVSREAQAASEARVDQSWSGFLPQLLVSLGYRRATMNSPAPPYIDASALPADFGSFLSRREGTSYDNFSAGVTLNQTIWDFGRTLGGMKAAKAARTGAGADVATSREQVRLNAIQAYYLVLATQEALGAAETTVRQMRHHLDVARAQADAGVRQRIDVTRAEADLASAVVNLSRARNGLQIARVNLNAAMGLDGGPEFRAVRPAPGSDLDVSDLDALVRRAMDARPEAAAVRARVAAATNLVDVARSGYYPALGLSAGVNWQGYRLESDALPYNWFVGLNLGWNALAPIPVSAAAREAQANVRAAQASLRSLELGIRAEVEAAALAAREARERLEPARALVAAAAETLKLAEGRYAAGAGSIVEVTDAQSIDVTARLGLIQAEFDVETARARLNKALGSTAGL